MGVLLSQWLGKFLLPGENLRELLTAPPALTAAETLEGAVSSVFQHSCFLLFYFPLSQNETLKRRHVGHLKVIDSLSD